VAYRPPRRRVKWAAERGLNVHQHAASDRAAIKVFDRFEAVNRDIPLASLRFQNRPAQ
jgi:predicted amidohydrolase YtcJ